MLEAVIASIGYAGGVVADKIILCRHRVPVLRFIPLLFIWLAIISAIFLPLYGSINWNGLLTAQYIILFILLIVVAVTWNIFYYKGIQKEEIHEFELIMLLSPLVTILLATIFLPKERDWTIFVAAVVASGALLATRFRHHHMKIGRTAWQTMLAMVLMSAESIFIKEMLAVMSPVTLYFIRTAIVGLVFLIAYRPKLFSMPRTAYGLTIISAIFGVVQMVLKFYGFDSLGVVETTMILVLGPFLVYFASSYYFKEQLYKRDIFAAVIVILCILFVTFKNSFL
ncbi:MAG: DMT family transporter [Patescibacteria group bacterium]|jgi:drug/metabolite transporter (DMT)-like permease